MPEPVITVENLGKRYLIGKRRSKEDGLRHVLENAFRNPLAWLRDRQGRRRAPPAEFWALRGVSFQAMKGEVIGVVGRNGAGKSTLLKLLSRITVPTEGRIRVRGRVASLLEVGTGFHQELTGRENIFLNGAILGMTRAEITRKFDEIVAFSEIEEFLDTPVKRYSSGMYVRLAFAVAAHLEPEILIVDEVLAVGDAAFQKKCLGKMGGFAQGGKTVLFVSHNMEAIRSLCHRGVWLKEGRLHAHGSADQIVQSFFDDMSTANSFACANPEYGLVIRAVTLKNPAGRDATQFRPGEDLTVEISFEARKCVEKPYLSLGVVGLNGPCFTANMLLDGARPDELNGTGTISCRFKAIPLLPQSYSVKMFMRAKNGNDVILEPRDVAYFNVAGDLADYGFKGDFVSRATPYTSVVVPYEWQLPDGKIRPVEVGAWPRSPLV